MSSLATSAIVMPEPAFKRFGKYEIQVELGRGGFGRVYRAFDPTVGRMVAIKILISDAGADLLTRFRNEAAAAGNLRHENIITIYELGEEKGVPFIVMEYLEGEDLAQTIAAGRALTLLEKVSIMAQTAAGLDCAHRNGVVHRDIKPANIRLLADGTVKIMDFGIARLIREDGGARLTRQGHVIGTLLYMAPEQVMGSDTDSLCDVFAYGVTFYELLAGRHPFRADDPRTIFYKITSEDPELIRQLVPECPPTLDRVIRRALQKDRELRYQTLRDLRLDIEPVLLELRRERATTLVAEAGWLVRDRLFDRASALLNEAIDLDPANTSARELRDDIQTEMRRQILRPRIDALLSKASQSTMDGNYAEALQMLDSALRLDPENASLQVRVKELQQQKEQGRESAALAAEAREDLAAGNLDEGLGKASQAVALNPKNVDAQTLVEIIRLELQKRERQKQLNEQLQHVRELLEADSLEEAFALLATLEPAQRESPRTLALVAQLKARDLEIKRQAFLAQSLNTARELRNTGKFQEAVQVLKRVLGEFPGEQKADELLAEAQQELLALERAKAISAALEHVGVLIDSDRPSEAAAILERAVQEFDDDRLNDALTRARSLAQAQQRRLLLEEIDRAVRGHLSADEFDDALRVLGAATEHIKEDELVEQLQQDVLAGKAAWEKARERENAIRAALQKAADLAAGVDFAAAIEELRAAIARFPENASLERALEQTERSLRDFEAAREKAEQERLRRAAALRAAVQRCSDLIASDKLGDAMQSLQEARSEFPHEPELVALEETLNAALERKRRSEAANRAADNARTLLQQGHPGRAIQLLEAAASRYPEDAVIQGALTSAREAEHLRRQAAKLESIYQETREFLETKDFAKALETVEINLAMMPGEPRLVELRETIVAATRDFQRLPEEPSIPKRRPPLPGRKPLLVAIGAMVATIGFALVAEHWWKGGRREVAFTVDSEPTGATVRIGSRTCATPDCRLNLAPGKYQLEANAPGYIPTSESVVINEGEAIRRRLILTPLPVSLAITTSLPSAAVYLDGKRLEQLKNGRLSLSGLQEGTHRLQIATQNAEAAFSFYTAPGHVPELRGRISARSAGVVAAFSMDSVLRASCFECSEILLDGKPLADQRIQAGDHELTATSDAGVQRAFLRKDNAPTVSVYVQPVSSGQGTLDVEANTDGATVSVNGQSLPVETRNGRVQLPLDPKSYTVTLQRQGFTSTPEKMVAQIRKGESFHARFHLQPKPSTLVIEGAPDGATVSIDGSPAGSTRNGNFSASVPAGNHEIGLTKSGFTTAAAEGSFVPGGILRLNRTALTIQPLPRTNETPRPVVQQPTQPPRPSAEELETAAWGEARSANARAPIQAFLDKYPNSKHRQEAMQVVAQLDWSVLNRKDHSALETFIAEHPGTPQVQQATTDLEEIQREAEASTIKKADDQATVDRADIANVLATYSVAFDRKDLNLLQSIWPELPKNALAQAFRGKGVIHSQLRAVSPIEITGRQATVRARRITEQVTEFGRQKPVEDSRTVRLRKDGARWVISSID